MKKILYTKDAPAPVGPYNQGFIADNILFEIKNGPPCVYS